MAANASRTTLRACSISPRVGWVAGQRGGREAERADVHGADPGRSDQPGADDDLRRAAADVADGDDAVAGIRAGDCTGEREPTFLLRGNHPHFGCRGQSDSLEQAAGVALTAGRRDHHFQLTDTELARDLGVRARHLGHLVELASPHAAVDKQLRAEAEVGALLADRRDGVVVSGRDEQAHRVRPHIDDPYPHPRHCGDPFGRNPGLTYLPCVLPRRGESEPWLGAAG